MATVIRPRTVRAQTMVELLRERAAKHGGRTAQVFLADDGATLSLTFAELDMAARSIAAHLQQQGFRPGERVVLVYPAGLEFLAAFFGCLYAGVVAVPATYPKPRRPLPRMASIVANSAARAVLTTGQTLATLDLSQQDPQVQQLAWIASDTVSTTAARRWKQPAIAPTDLAFLQYTSGSTSEPKGVMVSHANLLANLEAIRESFGIETEDEFDQVQPPTGVFWLPAYHDMGLIGGLLTPLYVGGRSVLMSPGSFLQKPLRWLQAISEYGGTISGAPNFAYEYVVRRTTPEERAAIDLSHWRLAFCGAEPVRAETLHHFAEAFAATGFRPEAFFPCYGLAETTLLVTGVDCNERPRLLVVDRAELSAGRVVPVAPADRSHRACHELVSCGEPTTGHAIEIVDPHTLRRCAEGCVGEIVVQGPSVTGGYFGRPEITAQTFGVQLPDADGPWLRTGDLGFVHAGELFVTGRVKDVIIIRGRNHYPQDIEQSGENAHPAVMAGAAFGIDGDANEQLVVVHQVDRQCPADDYPAVAQAIRRTVADAHELELAAVVLIRQGSLPITSSGKVQRSLCRKQYLGGKLKVLHTWQQAARTAPAEGNRQPAAKSPAFGGLADAFGIEATTERIELWLQEWLVDRLGLAPSDMSRERPFAELGVDSLSAVELSHELEQEFGVPLPPIVAWNYPTPGALAKYLAEQTCGGAAAATSAGDVSEAPLPEFPTSAAAIAGPPEAANLDHLSPAELESLLAEIEGLSDDQAAKLLR